MGTKRQRRHLTGQEKVVILRQHLLEGVAISQICEQHGVQPTQFYRWQKELFENGSAVFGRGRAEAPSQKLERECQALRDKLAKKDEVIAEIMEAHLQLKKSVGDH
jgi:transposase-like protein